MQKCPNHVQRTKAQREAAPEATHVFGSRLYCASCYAFLNTPPIERAVGEVAL
jgi:hypothetical protein